MKRPDVQFHNSILIHILISINITFTTQNTKRQAVKLHNSIMLQIFK